MTLRWDHPLMAAAREGLIGQINLIVETDNSLEPQDLSKAAMQAARCNHVDVMQALLDVGWDINTQETQRESSILMYSLRNKKENLATWLLEHGANANAADQWGVGPLAQAAMYCSLAMVRIVLKYGACVPGSRSLAAAAVSKEPGRVEKLDLLLQHGAEVNEKVLELPSQTQSGRVLNSGTALHAACKWGFEDSESYLLEHGADPELKTSNGLSIDDLKARQSSLAVRGWSTGMVSSDAKRRISERQKKEKMEQQQSPSLMA